MKTYIASIIITLVTTITYSQEGFGIKIGAQQHTFTTKYYNSTNQLNKSKQTTLNYSAGIVIRSKSSDSLSRFSSLVEVEYASFNTKLSDFRTEGTVVQQDYIETKPYESSFHSVNVKFLGGVRLFKKIYVEFGPEFNYIIGKDEVIYLDIDGESTPVSSNVKVLKSDVPFNRFRVFGVGGVFYEISNSFGFSARYHHEILSWKKRNHPTSNQTFLGVNSSVVKNNYLSIGLSYYF